MGELDDFRAAMVAARAGLDQTLPMIDEMVTLLKPVQDSCLAAGLSPEITALVVDRFMSQAHFMEQGDSE